MTEKESMPTDRTAAHVAAIQECVEIVPFAPDGEEVPSLSWDTAALTRAVEQIAAEAYAERDALRTACREIADDMVNAVSVRDLPTCNIVESIVQRLRALAGDAPPTGGTDALA